MATIITDIEQVNDLAESLLSNRRTKPWCVISTPNGETEAVFDVATIEDDVAAVCEVIVILGGPATRQLQELLPANTHVFGGAARVYPTSFGRTRGATVGKLRYVYPPGTVAQSTQRLTADIWAAAMDAGLLAQATENAQVTVAEVKQFFGDTVALLKLSNGDLVSLRQETTFPGVPLTWVFEIGQKVSGRFDASSRIFTLENQNFTAADAVAHFGFDTVTLGLVKETDRKKAVIAIHPNLSFEVTKEEITGNPLDVINEYLRVGEVWPVRLYRNPQGKTRLKMNDIDDDEQIAPALSLISGGSPWLDQARYATFGDDQIEVTEIVSGDVLVLDESEFDSGTLGETSPAPNLPAPAAVATVAVNSKDRETRLHEQAIAHYRAQIIKGNREIERLNNELNQLAGSYHEATVAAQRHREEATTYKQIVAEARKAKSSEPRAGSGAYLRRDRFETLEEWFNEELRRTWLGLYAPADRKRYPLLESNWTYNEEFFDGVTPRDLDETELRKLLRAIVHLVTGRNGVERIAESHELRANNKPLLRGNDPALRMHIENGQAQAKRLHYYKLAGGGYELWQVGNHDEHLD